MTQDRTNNRNAMNVAGTCSICGQPAQGSINVTTGAAPGLTGVVNDRFEPRCNEHNPFMRKCRRGHWQWSGDYCSTCGAKL